MSDFNKKLLIQGVIASVMLAVLIGAISYFYFSIKNNLRMILDTRVEIATSQRNSELLSQLRKEAIEANAILPALTSILPEKYELFAFQKSIGNLAKNRGVQFNFSFGGETPGDAATPSSIPFQITSGGKMHESLDFISDIEKSRYIVDLLSVDLQDGTARINGRVFYREHVETPSQ